MSSKIKCACEWKCGAYLEIDDKSFDEKGNTGVRISGTDVSGKPICSEIIVPQWFAKAMKDAIKKHKKQGV